MAEIKVRLAQDFDKEAVLAFCEHTLPNEEDYIHLVWDKWLADPKGSIFVVTLDDVPIAMERVVRMSEKEAWWEALRVNPNYRRQGLSKTLEFHINQYLCEANISTSRSCVYCDNEIVNGIMSRRGREKVGKYALYEAEAIASSTDRLTQLEPDNLNSIWSLITSTNLSSERQDFYTSRVAKCQELTREKLKELLVLKKAWGLWQNSQLLGIAIESYSEISERAFWVGYVNGTKENFPTILYELRKLAGDRGYPAVGGLFPFKDIFSTFLSLANYQRLEKNEYWLYQWQNTQSYMIESDLKHNNIYYQFEY